MTENENECYEFYVAGVQHHKLPSIPREVFEGVAQLLLEKEPTNKYDGSAVKVLFEDENEGVFMVGYVPAKLSAAVTHLIDTASYPVCEVVEYSPDEKPWKMLKVKVFDGEIDNLHG
jgi:hypothetical protein